MEKPNHLFNLYKINKNKNNSNIGDETNFVFNKGHVGPTGPAGLAGDRFSTRTPSEIHLEPIENMTLIFKVEPGLAYISGNSVIVAEVGNDINSELNTFEGTVQFYSKKTGEIVIKDITNIHGTFGDKPCYYYVNLDGVDGAIGPTGPSNVSETTYSLVLEDTTIAIPEQINPITYYTVDFKNGDELRNIKSNLKQNHTACILVELYDVKENENSSATIFPISANDISINYNKNIVLDQDAPFLMIKVYNIKDIHFIECVPYYKKTFITT